MKGFVLAGIILLTAGQSRANDLFVPGVVTGNNVNIRVGPSLRAEIVGQAERGEQLNVIASDGEWCAIVPPPGLFAWISAAYLKNGTVIADRVNVRSGPGISYARLTQLNRGARPRVEGKEGNWVKISLPAGIKLWVNARYMELAEGAGLDSRPDVFAPPQTQAREDLVPPSPESRPRLTPVRPSGTPFLPRTAPSYTPAFAREIRSRVGYIRALPAPFERKGLTITHELVRISPRPELTGFLISRTIELDNYQNRRVRLWAEERPGTETPLPVWEVKGIQILW